MHSLDQLKTFSTVVADTGDLEAIRKFQPQDATTNPSIILKTVTEDPLFFQNTLSKYSGVSIKQVMEHLMVDRGSEILSLIPGRVSTEIDAHLSFNFEETVQKAREIVNLYCEKGISPERVLIKIATTWEGIQAAKILENEGIHCNMTLVFSLEQAAACAEAGVRVISPFVGRILDWYKIYNPETLANNFNPGIDSVRRIFSYYRKWGYKTQIMAASFRSIDEIKALAGCDLLTINPKLLDQLAQSDDSVKNEMDRVDKKWERKMELQEPDFRLSLNENQMATEKLSEGIRLFCKDIRHLERLIALQW